MEHTKINAFTILEHKGCKTDMGHFGTHPMYYTDLSGAHKFPVSAFVSSSFQWKAVAISLAAHMPSRCLHFLRVPLEFVQDFLRVPFGYGWGMIKICFGYN